MSALCFVLPHSCIKNQKNDCAFRQNANWSQKSIEEIYKQASSSGADIIAIDGFRGGTGAAPTRIRDNVGIPIELALAAVDQRLRDEGIRNRVSIIAGGSIRSSADVIKAVALGADACCIAAAALLAMGCHLCRTCQSGSCSWGIATQRPELTARLDPQIGAKRLVSLLTAWQHEIKEFIGGRVGSFAGEYQAGGTILVLGLHTDGKPISGFFPCTGMHGGKMIFRGDVSGIVFPQQTTSHRFTAADMPELHPLITRFCALFGYRAEPLLADTYTVITPDSSNPYHQLYVAN